MKGTDIFSFTSNEFDTSLDFSTFFIQLTKSNWLCKIYSDVRSLYSRSNIVAVLIFVKLHSISSVRQMFASDFGALIKCQKDVVYSVKNNIKVNWRKLLLNQSVQCYNELDEPDLAAKDVHQIPCLIVDDTDIPKRGKCMEMIGKIFSHVSGRYPLGYKNLVLSYWTGKTVLHLDFSTHVEARKNGMQGLTKKQLKSRYSKERSTGSHGAKRVEECLDKKTTSLVKMLKRVLKEPFKVKYLLADSWFFNSNLVAFIKTTKLHLISRPKLNKWNYQLNGKVYTIGSLIKKYRNHSERKFSRKLNMHTVTLTVDFKGETLKLFLYKPTKRGAKWQVLISTDLSVSAIKAYGIYQNRWAIEVSFKELKQQLKFGKCQSRDFIGQIADHTICLLTYNLLSTYKCKNDYDTLGALFGEVSQKWIKPTIMQKFWTAINNVIRKIAKILDIEIDKLKQLIIDNDTLLNIFKIDAILTTTET